MKIHIPTKALERGILMPRDLETKQENYPKISDTLLEYPFKGERNVVKRPRKAKET